MISTFIFHYHILGFGIGNSFYTSTSVCAFIFWLYQGWFRFTLILPFKIKDWIFKFNLLSLSPASLYSFCATSSSPNYNLDLGFAQKKGILYYSTNSYKNKTPDYKTLDSKKVFSDYSSDFESETSKKTVTVNDNSWRGELTKQQDKNKIKCKLKEFNSFLSCSFGFFIAIIIVIWMEYLLGFDPQSILISYRSSLKSICLDTFPLIVDLLSYFFIIFIVIYSRAPFLFHEIKNISMNYYSKVLLKINFKIIKNFDYVLISGLILNMVLILILAIFSDYFIYSVSLIFVVFIFYDWAYRTNSDLLKKELEKKLVFFFILINILCIFLPLGIYLYIYNIDLFRCFLDIRSLSIQLALIFILYKFFYMPWDKNNFIKLGTLVLTFWTFFNISYTSHILHENYLYSFPSGDRSSSTGINNHNIEVISSENIFRTDLECQMNGSINMRMEWWEYFISKKLVLELKKPKGEWWLNEPKHAWPYLRASTALVTRPQAIKVPLEDFSHNNPEKPPKGKTIKIRPGYYADNDSSHTVVATTEKIINDVVIDKDFQVLHNQNSNRIMTQPKVKQIINRHIISFVKKSSHIQLNEDGGNSTIINNTKYSNAEISRVADKHNERLNYAVSPEYNRLKGKMSNMESPWKVGLIELFPPQVDRVSAWEIIREASEEYRKLSVEYYILKLAYNYELKGGYRSKLFQGIDFMCYEYWHKRQINPFNIEKRMSGESTRPEWWFFNMVNPKIFEDELNENILYVSVTMTYLKILLDFFSQDNSAYQEFDQSEFKKVFGNIFKSKLNELSSVKLAEIRFGEINYNRLNFYTRAFWLSQIGVSMDPDLSNYFPHSHYSDDELLAFNEFWERFE